MRQIKLNIDGINYLIDVSNVSSRDGGAIIIEPTKHGGITISLPHIPYFAAHLSSYIENGNLTDKAIDYIKQLLPFAITYNTALQKLESEEYYNLFWQEYGKKKQKDFTRLSKKLQELEKINNALKKKFKTDPFLEQRQKATLFSTVAKESKSIKKKLEQIQFEADETIKSTFKQASGVDIRTISDIRNIASTFRLFEILA